MKCRSCAAETITAVDSDTAGIPITIDTQPVDNFGEALALVQGRRTFSQRSTGYGKTTRRVLDERTAAVIRTSSRGLSRPVYPEHRCDQPLPAARVVPCRGWATGTEF